MMLSEKAKISSGQFLFAVCCVIQASSLLTSYTTATTLSESWFAVLVAYGLCVPLIFIFTGIFKRFPSKSLFEINSLVFGKAAGKVISALYLWFFMSLTALNLGDLQHFVKSNMLPKTPVVIITAAFTLLVAWAVKHGIGTITRYTMPIALFSFISLAFTILVVLGVADFSKLFPLFSLPAVKYVQGINTVMMVPLGEVVAFLMITPHVEKNVKGIDRHFFIGFTLGALYLFMSLVVDTSVLGNAISLQSLPTYETYKMVSLFKALTRVEIIFAMQVIVLRFIKVAFLYYVSIVGLSQLLGFKSRRNITFSIGAIILIYSFIVFDDDVQRAFFGNHIAPLVWPVFEFLLPLVTLILAKARRIGVARQT